MQRRHRMYLSCTDPGRTAAIDVRQCADDTSRMYLSCTDPGRTAASEVGCAPVGHAAGDLFRWHFEIHGAGAGIDHDGIAVAHRGDRAAARGFRRDVADQDAVARRRKSGRR